MIRRRAACGAVLVFFSVSLFTSCSNSGDSPTSVGSLLLYFDGDFRNTNGSATITRFRLVLDGETVSTVASSTPSPRAPVTGQTEAMRGRHTVSLVIAGQLTSPNS